MLVLAATGCIWNRPPPIVIDSKSEVVSIEVPKMPTRDAETVLLWPDDKDLKLEFDYRPFDTRGNSIVPLIKVQMQVWTDDSTGTFFDLSMDEGEYAVFDNVIVIYTQKTHSFFLGSNLRFRACLIGKNYATSWVKLPVSIRLYPADEVGIPLQPSRLQLVP